MPNITASAAGGAMPASDVTSRRRFLGALAAAPTLAVPAFATAAEMPAQPVSQALIDSYNPWLHYERRVLLWEVCKGNQRQFEIAEMCIHGSNAGSGYHFTALGRDKPISSALQRAAIVLGAVGCDWKDRDI